MDNEILEKKILPFVEKPARYCGGEINSVVKFHKDRLKICLVYPDLYEIGISNIGLRILYNILNNRDDIVCERAYSVAPDMDNLLKSNNLKIFSLETKTPLDSFDAIGFSFQYELLYTNFLRILELAEIPFYSKDRDEKYPIIFAGGPISFNLEPIADFLDVVCIGEGESWILEFSDALKEYKEKKLKKIDFLKRVYDIEGSYIPSFYETKVYNKYIIPVGKNVKIRKETNFDSIKFPLKQIVPNIQAIQDRAVIEVARGCNRGCRFCQAGFYYRPVREKNIDTLLLQAKEIIENTGYNDLSLISLSICDYSKLNELITNLDLLFKDKGISFSLPSLRIDSFSIHLAEKISEIRKSGLTFAVEGGSQNIRNTINKDITKDNLLNVIKISKSQGWKKAKFYFMIGLPNYNNEDEIEEIYNLIDSISKEIPDFNFTLSVAIFVPKAGTPFERCKQLSDEEGFEKIKNLIERFKTNRRVNIRYNNTSISFLEGIFSRGDRGLSKVILNAYQNGARFDGWSEHFNLDIWLNALKDNNYDYEYILAEKDINEILPWHFIDKGYSEEFLLKELNNSKIFKLSPACLDKCHNYCGLCDFKTIKNEKSIEKRIDIELLKNNFLTNIDFKNERKGYLRLKLTKLENSRYLNPIDYETSIKRALFKNNFPVVWSKGFNPAIKLEMNTALPIGYESLSEYIQIEISNTKLNFSDYIERFNNSFNDGIKITDYIILDNLNINNRLSQYSRDHFIKFRFQNINKISRDDLTLLFTQNSTIKKITKDSEIDLSIHNIINSFKLTENFIEITFHYIEGNIRIQDIISFITTLDIRETIITKPLILERFIIKDNTKIDFLNNIIEDG